jgi:hypothetical protein
MNKTGGQKCCATVSFKKRSLYTRGYTSELTLIDVLTESESILRTCVGPKSWDLDGFIGEEKTG